MTRIPEPKTEGERILAAYFVARGWIRGPQWQYEPGLDERRRRPDFRLRVGEWRCMLEMKEFGPSEAPRSAPGERRRGRHGRIAAKIRAARRQLREFHGDHACAAVLRSMGALVRDASFVAHLGAAWRGPWRPADRDAPVDAVLTVREHAGAVGVTVIEHPGAQRRFPSELFDAPWDECWAVRDGRFARVFAGEALRRGEAAVAAA
jgi:hypothetical protein